MIDIEKNKIDSGFKLPENYFDNFDKTILSKIKHQKNKQNNTAVRNIFVYTISIAASLLLIFTITNKNNFNLNNVDIENYILNDNFIFEESINTELADNNLQDEVYDSDIEDYLLYNGDFDEIMDN